MKLATLEERMNTKQAEYKTDIAMLAKTISENETRQTNERRNDLRWFIGFTVAAISLAVVVLKFA